MRGKKIDQKFVSSFISELSIKGISSSSKIKEAAEKEILDIDQKIEEVFFLKKKRVKLLDVISTLDKLNEKI